MRRPDNNNRTHTKLHGTNHARNCDKLQHQRHKGQNKATPFTNGCCPHASPFSQTFVPIGVSERDVLAGFGRSGDRGRQEATTLRVWVRVRVCVCACANHITQTHRNAHGQISNEDSSPVWSGAGQRFLSLLPDGEETLFDGCYATHPALPCPDPLPSRP